MPIRKDILAKCYGQEWKTIIRPKIMSRAFYRCERCFKPHRANLVVVRDGSGRWRFTTAQEDAATASLVSTGQAKTPKEAFRLVQIFGLLGQDDRWHDASGSPCSAPEPSVERHQIDCRVTIAHLNQEREDNRNENLAALCEFHHNTLDKWYRRDHARETRCERKDAARPLLNELGTPMKREAAEPSQGAAGQTICDGGGL